MDESPGPMTLNNDSIKETMKMIQMQGQMQQQEVMTQVIRFSPLFFPRIVIIFTLKIFIKFIFKEYY